MKYLVFFVFFVTLVILGSSCAISNVTRVSTVTFPAISPDNVTIFVDEEDLPADFEKVAIIKITHTKNFDNVKWAKARKRAAALGCNGVYERYANLGYGDEADRSEIIAIKY